ncbi:pyruvate kinase alpha/beta domain-containing protein, partial [Bogoriella caseilytica]
HAAEEIATTLGVKYLVTFTQSGDSARRMARLRSSIPHLAFTPDPTTRARLAVTWGTETYTVPTVSHTDDMVNQVDQLLQSSGLANEGDRIVVVAGMPPGTVGSTNSIRVHKIGETYSR